MQICSICSVSKRCFPITGTDDRRDSRPSNLACETGIIDDISIPGVDEIKLSPCGGMCFSEITGSEVYRGCMNKEDLSSDLDYSWVFGSYGTLNIKNEFIEMIDLCL